LGFFFATWEKRSFQLQWRTLAPALVAFSAYAVLLVQFRYISPFVVLLWLSLFSSLKFTSTQKMRNMVRFTLVCSCSVALIAPSALSVMALFVRDAPVYWEAASHLREGGVKPGDAIALIWNDDWENGAAGGSFVMRLMRAHAVGEAEPARIFWAQSAGVQSKVIRALFTTGAKAILARRPPAGARVSSCWQPLGSSGFYTCMPDPNSK
jgi:hypothetical protein